MQPAPLSNQDLSNHIKELLQTESIVPDGHNGALVVHVDKSGIRSAVATKVGRGWEIQNEFQWHPNSTGWDFGTNVIRTW